MSFSKAKLKRFNEVTDSPYSERFERKDSIRRFFREQFQNDKKSKEVTVTAVAPPSTHSDVESIKSNTESTKSKSSAYRLFRTPSLPRRLRFNRHNSDLTPKKSKHAKAAAAAAADAATASDAPIITIQSKEKTEKDELDAAKVEIMNKTEVLLEYEQLIDELKQKTHHLDHLNTEQADDIFTKGVRIGELEQEVSDCHKANELLKTISEQAIIKIDVLEGEIRMILRNHDNEIEFLIRTNAELEMRYEKLAAHRSKNVTSELAAIKSKLDARIAELNECQTILQAERAHMLEKDNECNKLLDENVSLVNQLDALKQQADDDMLAYALESHKLNSDLETEKREKTKIITELCLKAELLMEVQQELASKEADMDVERDELKNSYNVEVESVSKKFEQHMNSLNEINDMKLKELESNFTTEKITLVKEHNAAMLKLKDISQKEIDHINEMAEEKIRISEIQSEQKLMGLEASIEQAIQNEKDLWKVEIEKCQKIAETEIMQCEFEKQDLKTLLQSANDLMRQKDEKIEGLELQLVKESDSVESDLKKCQRELYNYHLTLNNTRSTVNILMERLRKSDKDVEILQMELDSMLEVKASMETQNLELSEELQTMRSEVTEYRNALIALRGSSMALERSMVEKESAFEKLLSSEEDTLDTVNQMGKLFNEKLEENIDKYAELYNDLKRKYDARETYIRDMKALLEEFATGIELARLELDLKEKTIYELMEENKNIKLETMTYKFKCEQYDFEQRVPNPSPDFTLEDVNGKSCGNDDAMVSNQLIENIINQLEKEANSTPSNVLNTELYSDEDKITVENMQLRDKVTEQMKQIELLQEMADLESSHAKENLELKTKLKEIEQDMITVKQFANDTAEKYNTLSEYQQNMQQLESLKDKDKRMKNKISQLQKTIKEHESTISELKENTVRTPLKISHGNLNGTPKTPKTPTMYLHGKENLSPIVLSPATGLIRSRLNYSNH